VEHVQLSQLPHTTTGNHEEKIVLNIMGKPWILMNGSINEQFGEKHVVIHVEYTAKHDDVTNFLYIYIYTLKLGQCWAPYGQPMGQLVGSAAERPWISRIFAWI
jgi:hypothetical protein